MKTYIALFSFFILSFNVYSQVDFDVCTTRINQETLDLLCDDELDMIRNEIFAHHGFVFTNAKYKDHFERMSWYEPVSNNNLVKLNELETHNVEVLKTEENKRNAIKKAIKVYFTDLKRNTSSNPLDLSPTQLPILEKALKYIDFDDMIYCGTAGRHRTTIDNGSTTVEYFIAVDGDAIQLGRNFGNSDLFPDDERVDAGINDEPIGWTRNGESGDIFVFYIDSDNNITFSQFAVVG